MIEAVVEQDGKVIIQREYTNPSLSLEVVLKRLEDYVTSEQLNTAGECTLRVRFK